MILTVIDGNGVLQNVVAQTQATPAKTVYTILVTGDNETLLPANSNRSGWLMQVINAQNGFITFDDTGGNPTQPGALQWGPGSPFSTATGYPVTTGEITVAGVAGDVIVVREW